MKINLKIYFHKKLEQITDEKAELVKLKNKLIQNKNDSGKRD